ncbi:MAG TPA: c-type cytochrome [Polyangiaceae bacterium]|jgi:hypothetical protein
MKSRLSGLASLSFAASLALGALAACSSTSSSPPAGTGGDAAVTGDDSGSGGGDSAAGDTWANWAQGFFTKYCVECHGVNDSTGRDYGVLANVVKDKTVMRCGVAAAQDPAWGCQPSPAARQFPISDTAGTNPKPTDAERNRVVAWITAGCP